MRLVGYNHLTSNKRERNNCLIKNNREMLLGPAIFMAAILGHGIMANIPWPLSQSIFNNLVINSVYSLCSYCF